MCPHCAKALCSRSGRGVEKMIRGHADSCDLRIPVQRPVQLLGRAGRNTLFLLLVSPDLHRFPKPVH